MWRRWGRWGRQDRWSGGGESTPPVPTYSISGVLTNSRDQVLVGKTVTLNTTGTTDALDSTVTIAGGAYEFTGVVAGSYDLLVDDAPYAGGATVHVVAANITQDFQAGNVGVPVQGYVLDGGGLSIDGVLVTATGNLIDTQTTDGDGFYEFETGDATFTLTPTKDGYEFAPVSREVVVFGEPVTVTNFVGTELYSIFGAILDSAGVPLDGVTVTLSGDASDSVETAAGAPYEFSGLSNGNYTVTPTLAGSTFSPDHIDVVVADGDESAADMQQVWTISGDIVDGTDTGIEGVTVTLTPLWAVVGLLLDDADDPIVGATVTLSGDADDTDTTDANGAYSFLLPDGDYTLTPDPTDYTFTADHEDVTVSGDAVTVDTMAGVYNWLVLPYTYDMSDVAYSSGGVADQLSDWTLWTGKTDAAIVTTVSDGNSFTPSGVTKAFEVIQNGTRDGIIYDFLKSISGGETSIRFAMLGFSAQANRMISPFMFNVTAAELNAGSPSVTGQLGWYPSLNGDPDGNTVYSNYESGTTYNEFNSASAGANAASNRWHWFRAEWNFADGKVRLSVVRAEDSSSIYSVEANMNAAGITLGHVPTGMKSLRLSPSEGGTTTRIAKLWIGTASDEWPT